MQTVKVKDSFISDLNTFSNVEKVISNTNADAFTRTNKMSFVETKEFPRKLSTERGDLKESKENSEKKKNVTRPILARINKAFPSVRIQKKGDEPSEIYKETEEFAKVFRKFTEVSLKIIRPKWVKARKNTNIGNFKNDVIRAYCSHYTDLAKNYYITRLKKAQLDYLVNLNVKDSDLNWKVVKQVAKKFLNKEDVVSKEEMKFFFYLCFEDNSRIRENLESIHYMSVVEHPISDYVSSLEKSVRISYIFL